MTLVEAQEVSNYYLAVLMSFVRIDPPVMMAREVISFSTIFRQLLRRLIYSDLRLTMFYTTIISLFLPEVYQHEFCKLNLYTNAHMNECIRIGIIIETQ